MGSIGQEVSEWDRVSKSFAQHCNAVTIPHATDLLNIIYPKLVSSNGQSVTILDVACGAGAFATVYFRSFPNGVKGHRLILTDASKGMIEETKRIMKEQNFDNTDTVVEFKVENALNISSIENHSVDIVTSTFGVFLIPDSAQVLSEIKRMIKPHGTFLTTAWTNAPSPFPVSYNYLKCYCTNLPKHEI